MSSTLLPLILVATLIPIQEPAGSMREAEPHQVYELVKLNDVRAGSLLLRTDLPGAFLPALTQETTVEIQVEGMIVRGRVVQTFRNPTSLWVEGVYAFPLPETAAVDTLQMQIGERTVEGVIQEREEAKKTYEKAKARGRKATLVEQERPNLFTTSVANLGPGEEIQVTLEYQHDLHYDAGRFSLRFPMVVGPRYIPGTSTVQGVDGNGWATNTDVVADASRVTPPVVPPNDPRHGRVNPVTLAVDLNSGLALEEIQSPSHQISVRQGSGRHRIELTEHAVADRDFVLEWWPRLSEAPQAAFFVEQSGQRGEKFVHLMVVPPQSASRARLPREVIYVIDTSGSMGGASIVQARQALVLALERLMPGDRFNVIRFSSSTSALHPQPVMATAEAVAQARRWVEQLQAGGGTEMAPALAMALDTGGADLQEQGERKTSVRQVIFATDGAVGNEEQLFSLIQDRLGRSRLFTIGIGSAPNSHFMRRAAQHGRGTFTHIGTAHEVSARMDELFQKLETPVLSDIEVDWGALTVEAWPNPIPDLYAGEPVTLAARLDSGVGPLGTITVRGRRAGADWTIDFNLDGGQESGIGKLWARRKIASLMDGLARGVPAAEVRKGVVDLGLHHHLVTQYTSLVAVERRRSRPQEERVETRAIPVNLPEGWEYEKVFGSLPSQLPQGATSGRMELLLGLLLIGAWFLLDHLRLGSSGRHGTTP